MAAGGKGSTPRPLSVDRKTFDDNWDRIFRRDNTAVKSEAAALSRMASRPSDAEQQSAAWLKDEYYDVNQDRDDTIV